MSAAKVRRVGRALCCSTDGHVQGDVVDTLDALISAELHDLADLRALREYLDVVDLEAPFTDDDEEEKADA
ncbi:hypothetical protein AB0I28_12350 [Phytomonospora sp. NPDC050363]|uniref:hypothetical protein n=1 Tax=Phytomonospora sp. NPDC050363 TaxID=3155642 RepID=UPI00340AECF3